MICLQKLNLFDQVGSPSTIATTLCTMNMAPILRQASPCSMKPCERHGYGATCPKFCWHFCSGDSLLSSTSDALRCKHLECRECLKTYWSDCIVKNEEAFPHCPQRGCEVHASRRALATVLPPLVMQRLRYLQAQVLFGTPDGRPSHCTKPGCNEPLPPPTLNPGCRSMMDESRSNSDSIEDRGLSPVLTCSECEQQMCVLCGNETHTLDTCGMRSERHNQAWLYQLYAVQRISACPGCGVHVACDIESCGNAQCGKCGRNFTFVPFRSVDEVKLSEASLISANTESSRVIYNPEVNVDSSTGRTVRSQRTFLSSLFDTVIQICILIPIFFFFSIVLFVTTLLQ